MTLSLRQFLKKRCSTHNPCSLSGFLPPARILEASFATEGFSATFSTTGISVLA